MQEINSFIKDIIDNLKNIDPNIQIEGSLNFEIPVLKIVEDGKVVYKIIEATENVSSEKIILIKIKDLKIKAKEFSLSQLLDEAEKER